MKVLLQKYVEVCGSWKNGKSEIRHFHGLIFATWRMEQKGQKPVRTSFGKNFRAKGYLSCRYLSFLRETFALFRSFARRSSPLFAAAISQAAASLVIPETFSFTFTLASPPPTAESKFFCGASDRRVHFTGNEIGKRRDAGKSRKRRRRLVKAVSRSCLGVDSQGGRLETGRF